MIWYISLFSQINIKKKISRCVGEESDARVFSLVTFSLEDTIEVFLFEYAVCYFVFGGYFLQSRQQKKVIFRQDRLGEQVYFLKTRKLF